MNRLVHLSDLHIAQDRARQALLFDTLVETLGRERAAAAPGRVVVAWDFTCERRVELREGARLRQYVDFIALSSRARAAPRRLR